MLRNVNTKLNTQPMKNLKTKTQSSARNLFTSCLCGLSSAVLASSFALFAPSASAFTLVDSDEDGYLEGVTGLNVAGSDYDVEFFYGTFDEVYNDGGEYDFTFDSVAEVDQAFDAVWGALFTVVGTDAFKGYEDGDRSASGFLDMFMGFSDGVRGSYRTGSTNVQYNARSWFVGASNAWVKFNEAQVPTGGGENGTASTPEPSLILGFITLGGLMLGSKRKTKG